MSDITTDVDSENRVNDLYEQHIRAEAIENEKALKNETASEEVAKQQPVEEKAEEVAQEVIQKAEVAQEAVKGAAVQGKEKVALPALKLKTITREDIEKKDKALVNTHIPSRIKNVKWDAARNVVVVVKSGKSRLYQIGQGAKPALFESENSSAVTAFLNRM